MKAFHMYVMGGEQEMNRKILEEGELSITYYPYEKGFKDGWIQALREIEKIRFDRIRFIGDRLDHFEHRYHNQLDFKQSRTLNIIYKEIWEYASLFIEKIEELKTNMEKYR